MIWEMELINRERVEVNREGKGMKVVDLRKGDGIEERWGGESFWWEDDKLDVDFFFFWFFV